MRIRIVTSVGPRSTRHIQPKSIAKTGFKNKSRATLVALSQVSLANRGAIGLTAQNADYKTLSAGGIAMSRVKQTWRIMRWDARTQMWLLHSEYKDEVIATQHAEDMKRRSPRIRIWLYPATRPVIAPVKPPVNNDSRAWREEQLGEQIELQDANKRYKSMG